MDVQAVSTLLAALLILAIGASVLLRSRQDRMYTAFAAFTFTVSAWQLCSFIASATASPVMRWLSLWAAATIPPTAIRFFRIFLAQPSIGGPKRGPRVTLAWTLLAYAAPIVSAVKTVSQQTGRSMPQVALAWLRYRTVPVIPIIGARKVSQLQDNLASLDLELSAEQLKSLNGASHIELGFPQSMYEREMVRGVRYGGTWDRLVL